MSVPTAHIKTGMPDIEHLRLQDAGCAVVEDQFVCEALRCRKIRDLAPDTVRLPPLQGAPSGTNMGMLIINNDHFLMDGIDQAGPGHGRKGWAQ